MQRTATLPQGDGYSIQQIECADSLAAWIDATFNLRCKEHAVMFKCHVNFVWVAAAIVPQQSSLGVFAVGLRTLGCHVAFESGCVNRTVGRNLRRGIENQTNDQLGIKEVHLWCPYGTF